MQTGNNHQAQYEVAIIGAGFSGLGMAIKLQQAGINSFIIAEAADEVGGTWRDSKYPGAAVDVPNHLYSYSFEQNPEWTRMFSKSGEIQNYIKNIADKYNLRPKISFNTRVNQAEFDTSSGHWVIQTKDGRTITAHFVVSAIGPFAAPSIPRVKGLDQYQGQTVHTAKWNPGLDLRGKTVAVVGSGASAIQVAPAVAEEVKELKVFQRTPSWIIPKLDYEYSEVERMIYRNFPMVQQLRRYVIYGLTELLATAIVWDTPMTSLLERICRRHIDKYIQDPPLKQKVTPTYRLGSTRMLISNDWYPTLARDNVKLIDHGVEALTEKGLVAGGKEYQADVIIWATGYKSPSQGFPFTLLGRHGQDLNSYWKDGAKGYKGLAVSGFPNLFSLMGPNTGPGHTSVLVYVEAQQDYILQAIQACQQRGLQWVDVHESAQNEFNQFLKERMKQTTWGQGGSSWYYTKDGLNTTLYPGFASEYVLSIRDFDLENYEVQKAIANPVKEPVAERPALKVV